MNDDKAPVILSAHKHHARVAPAPHLLNMETSNTHARVEITTDDSKKDGTMRVRIDNQWVAYDDAAELSVYFKRLAKKLRKHV